jgi:type IV secretion system protein VirB10
MARDPLTTPTGGDPRLEPSPRAETNSAELLRPTVANVTPGPGPWLIGAMAAVIGLLVFLWLATHRPHPATSDLLASGQSTTPVTAPPSPPDVNAMQAEGFPRPAPPPAPAETLLPAAAPPPTASAPVAQTAAQTGKAPVLVVDFSPGGPGGGVPAARVAPGAKSAPAAGATDAGLNPDERFLARVAGGPEPARASATMLHDQGNLIPQGSTIPAVLETALDSDLPGYVRAVVSRDVRGFDASTVLIPRGSRVIGEYRSAVSQGQTRAFVIWTRIIRPDGASIMIGSGGGDTLGRAGLAGKVDTHFLQEFSGAILLTALNAGAAAVAGVPQTEVVVSSGSGGAAGGLTGPFAALAPVAIPPTIKVAQGTPLLIIVQRDLDFSRVQGDAR